MLLTASLTAQTLPSSSLFAFISTRHFVVVAFTTTNSVPTHSFNIFIYAPSMANNLIKELKKKKNGVFPVSKVYCLFAFPLFVEIKEQTSSGPDIQKCSCVFYNAVPEFLVHFQSGTNWAIGNRTIEIPLLSCFASKADRKALQQISKIFHIQDMQVE